MRSLAVIALLAACTLHVEMDVRSVASPREPAASSPWRSPAVATTTPQCQPLAVTSEVCSADSWAALDTDTCHWKCAPMPASVRAFRAAFGHPSVRVLW